MSNHVDSVNDGANGFEADPWAIGTNGSLTAGQLVPADTTFTFTLDLTDPDVLAYIQDGLSAGQLGFAITSLHPAVFGGSQTYPRFYTREAFESIPATLTVEYELVPEPGALALFGVGGALMLARRRPRRPVTR